MLKVAKKSAWQQQLQRYQLGPKLDHRRLIQQHLGQSLVRLEHGHHLQRKSSQRSFSGSNKVGGFSWNESTVWVTYERSSKSTKTVSVTCSITKSKSWGSTKSKTSLSSQMISSSSSNRWGKGWGYSTVGISYKRTSTSEWSGVSVSSTVGDTGTDGWGSSNSWGGSDSWGGSNS